MLVLRGLSVIDCIDETPKDSIDLVVEDATIRALERRRRAIAGKSDQTIDCRGLFAVPGLIDAHTHFCLAVTPWEPGSDDPRVTALSIAKTAAYALQNARDCIESGITTVRDAGSPHYGIFEIKRLIDGGEVVGPTIIGCGRAIRPTGGHGRYVGVAADGPDDVRKAARKNLEAGAQALKLMASGAGAESRESPYEIGLTEAEMAAAIEVARGHGRSTCAHSINPESTRNAVLAGVDSIEHGVLLDDASLQLMKEHDVAFVPTVWTYQNTSENGMLYGVESWMLPEIRRRVNHHLAIVNKAHEMGLRIAAGTDSSTPIALRQGLFWELEWLVHCGLTPLDAIRSATQVNASLLRRLDLGTLAAGQAADILVVNANPLDDVRNLQRSSLVLKSGRVVAKDGRLLERRAVVDRRTVPEGPTPSAALAV